MPTLSFHPSIDPTDGLLASLELDFSAAFTPQILMFFEELGDLRRFDRIVLPGQPVAAVLLLPLLEMSAGLPAISSYGVGYKREMVIQGTLSLGDYRHNIVGGSSRQATVPYQDTTQYWTGRDVV